MRVLAVTSLFPRCTAPTLGVFILKRLRAVAEKGAEVRVVAPLPFVPPGPVPVRYRKVRETPGRETVGGIPVEHPRYFMLPKLGMHFQASGYARGIRSVLRGQTSSYRPEILDVHYLYPDACGVARAARELGLPYVCTARGTDVKVLGRIPAIRRQIQRALAGAAAVVAVSNNLAATMRELGLHRGPIRVISNGVDRESFFPRPRAEARRQLGIDHTGRMLVCVGHLVPVHGQETLIRALAEPGAPADIRVWFVGDGPDRPRLARLARALALASRVSFVGTVPHERIPLWFCASDASVQLSSHAGSPNAVLESLACGTPVIASDLPEMREPLGSQDAGWLVRPSPQSVAGALAQVTGSERASTAAAVPTRSWEDVGAEVVDLFRFVLQKDGSPRD